jgi:hypothetical protein
LRAASASEMWMMFFAIGSLISLGNKRWTRTWRSENYAFLTCEIVMQRTKCLCGFQEAFEHCSNKTGRQASASTREIQRRVRELYGAKSLGGMKIRRRKRNSFASILGPLEIAGTSVCRSPKAGADARFISASAAAAAPR